MKKIYKFALLFAAVALAGGMTSCGSDDDDDDLGGGDAGELWSGSLDDPEYYNDAAKFVCNTSTQNQIESIELTESGNYIVIPVMSNGRYASAPNTGRKSHDFARFRKRTRDYEDFYIFGDYTRNSDGSYNLKGYGTLNYSNGVVELALNDGQSLSIPATVSKPAVDDTELDRRLCRTWYVTGAYEEVKDDDGRVLYSHSYNSSEIRDEFVKSVIVSRFGTFTQVEWDNEIDGYGVWEWSDRGAQIFQYKFSDEYYWGDEQVRFSGNKATFVEESWREYDEDLEQYVTFSLQVYTEAR